MADSKLIPVFIPALVALLLNLERKKGSPLSEQDVIDIRDKGVCVMLPIEQAKALAEKRGYDDIDPENVWVEWKRARIELAASEASGAQGT
jgi:hypothetical protein